MRSNHRIKIPVVTLAALCTPALALAHTGQGPHAFPWVAGLLHSLTGLDHVLAALAVGLWAVQRGGRRRILPAVFVGAMSVGAAAAASGLVLPAAEPGVAVSVVLLGLGMALAARLPTLFAAGAIGVFGASHGAVHGMAMPVAGSPSVYLAGLIAATAALHGLGMGLAELSRRQGRALALRLGGGVLALTGTALLAAA